MKKYIFYLVCLVALVLSSCNKNKLYYPTDFYQGTMQTCIDKNNRYVRDSRFFHIYLRIRFSFLTHILPIILLNTILRQTNLIHCFRLKGRSCHQIITLLIFIW